MNNRDKFTVLLVAGILSFGMLSISYGFWTDSLKLEGDAKILVCAEIKNDILKKTEKTEGEVETNPMVEIIQDEEIEPQILNEESSQNNNIISEEGAPEEPTSETIVNEEEDTPSEENN